MGTDQFDFPRRSVVAGFLFVLATLGMGVRAARADLDVTIANNTIVDAQLDPADEIETYRFTVTAGSKVSITVKTKPEKKATPPALAVEVLDDEGKVVATGIAKGKSVKVRGFIPETTGEYRVVVAGDGNIAGAYQLKAKWKPPTRIRRTLTLGEAETFAFDAAPRSRATVKVKAAKGSTALPRLRGLTSTDKGFQYDAFAPPRETSKSHAQKKIDLGPRRAYELLFDNAGEAGDVVVDIKLKAPKIAKVKVDLRNPAIGGGDAPGASGGKPVIAFGGVIGPAGGSLGVSNDIAGLLAGTGIEVPPGAMTSPTAITFGEAINDFPAPNDVLEPLGPTVFFGPQGLQFGEPAMVTIPFDLANYDGDIAEIEIYAREEDGTVALIPPPYEFDLDTGTCTFPVSGFTSFRAFAPPQTVFVVNELAFSPEEGASGDEIGASVAIDGATLVIGAPRSDIQQGGEGAVYVYTRGGKGWQFAQKLTASDPTVNAGFGTSVAIEGSTIVVGAPLAQSRVLAPGAVYVFDVLQSNWIQFQKLIGSNVGNGDAFGTDVAINGGTLVASAPGESQGTGLENAGAVYVFEPIDGFVEDARLTQSNPSSAERFGSSIALQSDTLVIGAQGTLQPGRAFVFGRGQDGGWVTTQELFHGESAGEENFGHDVAIDGDIIVVTDERFDDPAAGGGNAGRAFVFALSGTWSLERALAPPIIETGSRFGGSATVTGNFVVIGHPGLDLPSSGAGAIHVFERRDRAWPKVVTRAVDSPALLANFGSALAVDGQKLVVGESAGLVGPGTAYLYDLIVPTIALER